MRKHFLLSLLLVLVTLTAFAGSHYWQEGEIVRGAKINLALNEKPDARGGVTWLLETNSATDSITASTTTSFSNSGSLMVYGGKMWSVGGLGAQSTTAGSKLVRYSEDGTTWFTATTTAAFAARYSQASCVFNGKMWIICGNAGGSYSNELWYSTDGITWTAAGVVPFSARGKMSCVVFDGKAWIIGGYDTAALRDVWSSPDGVNWTVATTTAAFSARYAHASVVFNGKMWVIGGSSGSAEVWSSVDGISWTLVASAAFPGRYSHTALVYDGKMWVIGGNGSSGREVWSSPDGATWTIATSTALPAAKSYHSSVVFDGAMWVVGGSTAGDYAAYSSRLRTN